MKRCLRTKSIYLTLFVAMLCFFLCLTMAACSFGDQSIISNEEGFVVQGGEFEEGSTLDAKEIQEKSEDYVQALEAVEEYSYDKSQPVYVFEVSVVKDGAKVQPNGKVKVTIPVSEDLTGYDVLHIKDDGKIERLSTTYSDGKVSFETDSFSKFVFVKKVASGTDEGKDDDGGGSHGGPSVTKYSFLAEVKTFTGTGSGGDVKNADGEYIGFVEKQIEEGTDYTVYADCYNNYVFLGWYNSSDDALISTESSYTFTVNGNISIYARYAKKTDIMQLTLSASSAGFTCSEGQPVTTLVAKDSTDIPSPSSVYVYGKQADGIVVDYGASYASNFMENITIDDGGFDSTKVGTYTISYIYKSNPTIKAELTVQVVEGGNTLKITTSNKLKFDCNGDYNITSYEKVVPNGKQVTIEAITQANYAFTGWYNSSDDSLVSKDIVYCFVMPDNDVSIYGTYESSSTCLKVSYSYGDLVDAFGNDYGWNYNGTYVTKGAQIALTIRVTNQYDFLGWYETVNDEEVLLTSQKTIDLTVDKSRSIFAKCREHLQSLELSSSDLEEKGFINGQLSYAIGDGEVDYSDIDMYGNGVTGSFLSLSASDYDINDGGLNFNKAGTYTITYTYKYDTNIKTELKIVVVDPNSVQIAFSEGYSYLDHEYNGKASFISLRDVSVNGVPLYNFKANSKIWDSITYRWIDKNTGETVDTNGVDVTINGTTVEKFGSATDKMTVGNEFCGPIAAGEYKFELLYDGKAAFTQDATITTLAYKKITSSDEFKTNEGSIWVNFELYYYTIAAEVNGEYYVMQMPSIGYGEKDAEARKATVDKNGNIILGEGNDFAFVNIKYKTSDGSGYTEFLTGYYGSFVVRSSSNSSSGLFGSPYIYRTGYTSVSGGRIYREYGEKEYYGNITEFAANGSAIIYSRYYGETSNNRLRLVKDGDKYVFTSIPADEDSRESYDVFIFQSTK